MVPYGMAMPDYFANSFLVSKRLGRNAPFLKLEGSELPFDTAVFVELDATAKPTTQILRSPLRSTEFVALLRSSEEQRELVNVIIGEQWN